MLMSSSKLFLLLNKAYLNSGVRLLLELYCVIVIKHVAFFTICAKLLVTMAFTFTFPDVNCGFGFEQKYWWIDGFGEKKGMDWQICIPQGSYRSWKTWKVLKFYCGIFQDWKVLGKGYWSWKVLETC